MSIKEDIPFLIRNEGIWEGYYRYYDADGNKVDEHKSRLMCRIIDDEDYHQTNCYFWKDGKKEVRDFPTRIEDKRLVFYTDIDGWAAAVDLDKYKRTMMLNWVRKGEDDLYLYEMIQMSDDGQTRARVWQWFKEGRLFMRTLIDEQLVSRDWQSYEERKEDDYDLVSNF